MRRAVMLVTAAAALWMPQVARPQDDDQGRMQTLMQAAAGRMIPEPPPAIDPNLIALTAHLARIAESHDGDALAALADPEIKLSFGGDYGRARFREMMTEDWFWPAFRDVVDGGGILVEGWPEGRGAVFPAVFETWPSDLDPYEHSYGKRPGGILRSQPDPTAPAISGDINGRILVEGPYLPAFPLLYESGWRHLCMMETGCGFARDEDVRSPLDWRAVFVQRTPDEPWVLRTFIAGD